MKKGILLAVGLALCLTATALAQSVPSPMKPATSDNNLTGLKASPTQWSLLDPSRIRWSHSYSFSYFSGGNYSGSVGLLNTGMLYEFSPKLSLAINVGLLHNPGAIWGDRSNNQSTILPGFRLDYHPSSKMHMSIMFQRYQGLVSPYYFSPVLEPWNEYMYGR